MIITLTKYYYPFFVSILYCSFLYPPMLLAETDDDTLSSVTIELGGDNDGGRDYFVNMDSMLDKTHQVYASYGKQSTTDDSGGTTKQSYSIGIEDQAETKINTGFGLDWWGNENFLSMRSLKAVLSFNADNYSVTLSPIIKRFRIEWVNSINVVRTVDINSDGWSASLLYFLPDHWYLVLRRSENNFNFRGTGFSRSGFTEEQLIRLSDRSPLESYNNTFTIGAQFGSFDISFDWSESKPFIGRNISKQNTLSLDYPLNKTISLLARLGKTKTDMQSRVLFSSLAVTFVW